jgi:hypothetical protein
MARAEAELRSLRRELLLVRAAAERAALADRLDRLESRSGHGLRSVLLAGADGVRRSGLLQVALSAVRIFRSQRWLLPTIAGIARSRTLRWLALAAAIGAAVWWVGRYAASAPASQTADEADAMAPDDMPG